MDVTGADIRREQIRQFSEAGNFAELRRLRAEVLVELAAIDVALQKEPGKTLTKKSAFRKEETAQLQDPVHETA